MVLRLCRVCLNLNLCQIGFFNFDIDLICPPIGMIAKIEELYCQTVSGGGERRFPRAQIWLNKCYQVEQVQ